MIDYYLKIEDCCYYYLFLSTNLKEYMPKVLTIVGARPQFVKAAALSRALKEEEIEEILVHTGQHFDENMAEIFFKEMKIPEPKYNLGINFWFTDKFAVNVSGQYWTFFTDKVEAKRVLPGIEFLWRF